MRCTPIFPCATLPHKASGYTTTTRWLREIPWPPYGGISDSTPTEVRNSPTDCGGAVLLLYGVDRIKSCVAKVGMDTICIGYSRNLFERLQFKTIGNRK